MYLITSCHNLVVHVLCNKWVCELTMASGKMTGEWVPDELEGVMYDSEVEQAIHEVYINTLINDNNNIHII